MATGLLCAMAEAMLCKDWYFIDSTTGTKNIKIAAYVPTKTLYTSEVGPVNNRKPNVSAYDNYRYTFPGKLYSLTFNTIAGLSSTTISTYTGKTLISDTTITSDITPSRSGKFYSPSGYYGTGAKYVSSLYIGSASAYCYLVGYTEYVITVSFTDNTFSIQSRLVANTWVYDSNATSLNVFDWAHEDDTTRGIFNQRSLAFECTVVYE